MLVLGLVDVPWWGILLAVIIVYLCYSSRDFNFFRKQGIRCGIPLPLVGTMYEIVTKDLDKAISEAMSVENEKGCTGGFLGSLPALTVFGEDLLSAILVKEFSAFTNRTVIPTGSLSDYMLINLKDQQWKHVRNEITPTFTTGKLKKMHAEFDRCAKSLADSLLESAKSSEMIELKEYTGGYSMDVIASTAFGIRVESQKDRNNVFVSHAKKSFQLDFTKQPLSIIRFILPTFNALLTRLGYPFELIPKETQDFFYDITKQTIEMRKEDVDQTRTDFLQLMIKAQRGENIKDDDEGQGPDGQGRGLTTEEILANAMVFFVAGYDTTAISLGYFLHNMAVYPEYQARLVEEIDRVVGDKDSVDYRLFQEMPYLEQCINENLRLYPPVPMISREANKDITVKGIFIKKGMNVTVPAFYIHRDPAKWPEPEKFDPERFSADNKKNRNPYHFLPFGYGPRNCIGMRLALEELKVAIVHVLKKVKVSTCEKTEIPLKVNPFGTLLRPKGGIWLKMEPRNQK